MPKRTCSLDSCDRPHLARGWCAMHYSRWRHHGTPGEAGSRREGVCTVDDCGQPHEARGFCNKHYLRRRVHGDPLTAIPRSQRRHRPRGTCSIEGCARPHEARGWCQLHYREHRHQELGTCTIDGCTRTQVARGWCGAHYARWKAHGDPIWQSAYERRRDCPDGYRRCSKCDQVQPLDQFPSRGQRLSARCRACEHAYSISTREQNRRCKARTVYGIDEATYDALYADPRCAVCGVSEHEVKVNGKRSLHFDHDHRTGQLRGLLCHSCNIAIGLANDDPALLRAMADYLEAVASAA